MAISIRLLAICLICGLGFLALPVSAIEYDYAEYVGSEAYSNGAITGVSGINTLAPAGSVRYIRFGTMENHIRPILMKCDNTGSFSVPENTQGFPIEFKISTDVIGTGYFQTWRYAGGHYFQIDFNEDWNAVGYTGTQNVQMVGTGTFPSVGADQCSGSAPTFSPSTHAIYLRTAETASYTFFRGYISYYWKDIFSNKIYAYKNNDLYYIGVNRTVSSGMTYPSYVSIRDGNGIWIENSTLQSVDILKSSLNPPFYVSVRGTTTPEVVRYLYTDEGSGGSTNATLTAFIRRSDTGALISDSHFRIVDTDTSTEVINQTLPSGSGSFSIPKTVGFNPMHYSIQATADGFTQRIPALFFSITGDMQIAVEMDPVGGDPVTPENAYVQFFVRGAEDQIISSAAVLMNGIQRTTNSQGYVQFEVARNATYEYTVSKSGYIPVSGNVVVGATSPVTKTVILQTGTPTATPTSTGGGGTQWTPDPGASIGDNARGAAKSTLLQGLEIGQAIFLFALLFILLAVIKRGGR